jgi:uncharacterized protein
MRFQIKNNEGKFGYDWEDDRILNKEDFVELHSSHIASQVANLKQLTFEITDSCNLNCKYCGYGELYGDYDN